MALRTIEQAADILNVSRAYVIKLLNDGRIPYCGIGEDRRLRSDDLMTYKKDADAARLMALEELSAIDQEFGLGYES
ncbi:Helix-turn-helix domain protein [Aquisphaera giovannonii]|uniref:Helix-turn-helix domain protein n=1 Tax=Aquisphaera giovannonii TaxID=406548 RepID=A0A5B9WDA8_9BACT|nr:helix-turn-helix domain-containing protein [Aquisphaera giovannonii]QEH38254.1 Helix-turn-helix domain protein [Aquisphaera giovannonii]